MIMKPVFENYNEIVERLKPLRVNSGGCGFFAYELGKLLKEKKIKFKYIMLFNYIRPKHNSNKLIKSNLVEEFNQLSWLHVMVKIDGYYIDAEGIHDTPIFINETMPTRVLTEKFFKSFVGIDRYWSSWFDRSNIKRIQEILKKDLVIK